MKRTLLAITLFALLLPVAQPARAADVSIDFFYNNLGGGSWIEVEGYGYGWQPEVAYSNPNWRPYADGYWAYTDVGWTWVSYEDFGWATYHYGRWARLADYGWVWFPGDNPEWGPAWVSWRVGGGYCGWAPLPPPQPRPGIGISFVGGSIGFGVDLEYDIGPAYYNFVDVRYIGEPVLRDRIFAPTQNVTYINQTVNVTNITTTNNVVYNYGPDYNTLSAQSSRPIQRLKLERQQNVDPMTAVKSGAITKVQGDKLVVAAPPKIQKPAAKVPPPPTVKTKVAQPKLEKGWTGVQNADQIKQKIKTEDHKQIPAPTGAAATGGRAAPNEPAGAAASPAGAAAPAGASSAAPAAAAASPVEKERGKGRGRRGRGAEPAQPAQPAQAGQPAQPAQPAQPPTTPAPAASPAQGAPAASPAAQPSPRGKARGLERGMPPGRPEQPPGALEEKERGKRRGAPSSPTPQAPRAGTSSNQPETLQSEPRGKLDKTVEGNISKVGRAAPAGSENAPEEGRQRARGAQAEERASAGGAPGSQAGPPQRGQPPAGAAPGEERGRGKAEGGRKKHEASPSPSPY